MSQHPTSTPTPREALQSFLQRLLRITAIDNRISLGAFAGTDKPLNLILKNAEEYRISHGPGQGAKLNENGVEVYKRKDATDKGRRDRGDNIYL
ncbi:hypothetical protein BYT27DRAFT_7253091 [Phlegmacium glaucopus]|nr:hypothetical protein BYT27DRAFT_7253091 [Phlegmacium glaucopus]